MRIDFAPMEGITDDLFRTLHHRYFPGVDRYFAPFLSPTEDGITKRERMQVLPENNPGIVLVPQLMTRQAESFLLGAKALEDLGYREVNWNLGCPSGTVTAKGKGAGLLAPFRRQELVELLDRIFSECTIEVSLKVRLGMEMPEDFPDLLELFNRYPVKELIVHPRVRSDFYKKPVRMEWFWYAMEHSRAPVCLSGGVPTKTAFDRLIEAEQPPQAVMLGRGLVADPALADKCRGGSGADRSTLEEFFQVLFQETASRLGSTRSTMFRMKELWSYFILLFDNREKYQKALRRTTSVTEFQAVVARIFKELPLREAAEL